MDKFPVETAIYRVSLTVKMKLLVQHGVNKPPLRVRQFLMGETPIALGVSPWEKTGLPHHSKSMKRLRCINFEF
ncbi:hypothetical protein [Nostoc sp.]|uniref:hypothetical protein n=1 Tax=Nostoc sp. TaxID=1180 RepID=UPI002FFB1F80